MDSFNAHKMACWTCKETDNLCNSGRKAWRDTHDAPFTESEKDLIRLARGGRIDLPPYLFDRAYAWLDKEHEIPYTLAKGRGGDPVAWVLCTIDQFL